MYRVKIDEEVPAMAAIILFGVFVVVITVVGFMVYGMFLGLARLVSFCKGLWRQSTSLDPRLAELERWSRWERVAGS